MNCNKWIALFTHNASKLEQTTFIPAIFIGCQAYNAFKFGSFYL